MTAIEGQVRSRAGLPLPEARVYYEDAPVPVPDIVALTDHDGRFLLTAPVAGTYVLAVAMDGYETASIAVVVEREQSVLIDVALRQTDE